MQGHRFANKLLQSSERGGKAYVKAARKRAPHIGQLYDQLASSLEQGDSPALEAHAWASAPPYS